MRYLIINGSPHKGNTWKLVECARTQIESVDKHAEFRELHLTQLELPFCIGCSNCFRLGGEKCPHFSIMKAVYEDIDWADGLIVSSSVFNMRETGYLKNFMDHFAYMLHRPRFFTKKALVITTTGGVGAKAAAKSIMSTLSGIGFNKCYSYSCGAASWNAYEPKARTIRTVNKITTHFVDDISKNKRHQPKFTILIPYNLFRGMCLNYVKGTMFPTEDGNYWSDAERQKHVYDSAIPVSPIHYLFGQMFYLIGKVAGKKVMVTYRK